MKKPHEAIATFFLCLLVSSQAVAAGKFDFLLGFFNLKASASRGENTISNFGAYLISYRYPFLSRFELLVGYSLNASKTLGGDLGFGPDLGILYYPLTTSGTTQARTENINVESSEYFKPYFGTAFNQRQYQSTQSNYAGFSLIGGSEYLYRPRISFRAEIRYLRLIGPSQSTATEIDLLGGVTVQFGK